MWSPQPELPAVPSSACPRQENSFLVLEIPRSSRPGEVTEVRRRLRTDLRLQSRSVAVHNPHVGARSGDGPDGFIENSALHGREVVGWCNETASLRRVWQQTRGRVALEVCLYGLKQEVKRRAPLL